MLPTLEALHTWMLVQRDLAPEGSAIANALDYSLKRWKALTQYVQDGAVPINNNAVEKSDPEWALWTLELAVCRLATQWQTGNSNHELDPVGADEWA